MSARKRTNKPFLRRAHKKWRRFMRKAKKRRFWPIYGSLIFILFWALVSPASFSDFVWRYFWGPIVADACGHPVGGIHEGYNAINTLVYGTLVIALIYYGWKGIKRHIIYVDSDTVVALLPLIFVGALSRVLEDAGSYSIPEAYFFISPIIYLWIGFLALFFLLFAHFLEKRERYDAMVLGPIIYPFILKFLWYFMENRISGSDLVFFIVLSVLFMLFHFFMIRKKGYDTVSSVFLYSMYVLSFFVYYSFDVFHSLPNPSALVIIPLIALAVSAFMGMFSRLRFIPDYFSERMNLMILFSHSLDGAATWIGVDYYGYGEKHVLAGMLIGSFGGFSFFLSKLLLSIIVIYLVDHSFKKELRDPTLSGLIKFTIIFLGLGPGLRDMLRIALGV